MVRLAGLKGRSIYLDTNIFIHIVEGYAPYNAMLREFMANLRQYFFSAVTSELSLAEALVNPLKQSDHRALAGFETLLRPTSCLNGVAVNRGILYKSALLRAQTGMKLPVLSTLPPRKPADVSCF